MDKSLKREATATVQQGDAFELGKGLAPESVDLIITSPPYWGLRTYEGQHNWDILDDWVAATGAPREAEGPPYDWYKAHGGQLGLEPYVEWYVAHLVELFTLLKPALRASGSLWVNLGDTYFARWASIRDRGRQGLGDNPRERRRVPMGGYRQEKQLLLIPARFAIAMQEGRWILRNDLIWHKPNVPPRPERDRLRLAHEHFFHFVHRPSQGRAKYFYDYSAVESSGNDVITCTVKSGQGNHSATFPADLITPRILSSSPVGGTVLDPFAGSGRALVVAQSYGRNAIGFELSPAFASESRKAIAESRSQKR
ncbi:MAG: site-specific DNA-methyltransferase [Gemmatimonadetes bacterium]|nr:site-specific DNA-methyltransferase [Gemmatimonadota bacterium]